MPGTLKDRVAGALSELPTKSGGLAVVLATAGTPPAMALLSSGDVYMEDNEIRVGIYASSSAVTRLGTAFTLLVPMGEIAARIEATDVRSKIQPPLAMLEGSISSIRPTAEPPWVLEMRFAPEPPDDRAIPNYLEYWTGVRAWLSGQSTEPPVPPI